MHALRHESPFAILTALLLRAGFGVSASVLDLRIRGVDLTLALQPNAAMRGAGILAALPVVAGVVAEDAGIGGGDCRGDGAFVRPDGRGFLKVRVSGASATSAGGVGRRQR